MTTTLFVGFVALVATVFITLEGVAMLLGGGARLVEAFNTLCAEIFAREAHPELPLEEHIEIPLGGNDADAKRIVAVLIEAIGFASVGVGTLASDDLLESHRSLYDNNFTPLQVRLELARYERGQNSN